MFVFRNRYEVRGLPSSKLPVNGSCFQSFGHPVHTGNDLKGDKRSCTNSALSLKGRTFSSSIDYGIGVHVLVQQYLHEHIPGTYVLVQGSSIVSCDESHVSHTVCIAHRRHMPYRHTIPGIIPVYRYTPAAQQPGVLRVTDTVIVTFRCFYSTTAAVVPSQTLRVILKCYSLSRSPVCSRVAESGRGLFRIAGEVPLEELRSAPKDARLRCGSWPKHQSSYRSIVYCGSYSYRYNTAVES